MTSFGNEKKDTRKGVVVGLLRPVPMFGESLPTDERLSRTKTEIYMKLEFPSN